MGMQPRNDSSATTEHWALDWDGTLDGGVGDRNRRAIRSVELS